MTYTEWFDAHAKKHKEIVDKLLAKNFSQEQIIEYFEFENMVEKEKEFCLLYATNTKCHDLKKLNCYMCACNHFRFNDNGIKKVNNKVLYSFCSIEAKNGSTFVSEDAIHQDCTNCTIPHAKSHIKKHFDTNWSKMMQKTIQNDSN